MVLNGKRTPSNWPIGLGFSDDEAFTMLGDLIEERNEIARDRGSVVASIWYLGQVVFLLYVEFKVSLYYLLLMPQMRF